LCYFDPYLEDISIRVLTGPEKAHRLTELVACAPLDEDETQLDIGYDLNHKELNAS